MPSSQRARADSYLGPRCAWEIPEALRRALEAWASCIAGALGHAEYEVDMRAAGFTHIGIETVRRYTPSNVKGKSCWKVLAELSPEEREHVVSWCTILVVRARKPVGEE